MKLFYNYCKNNRDQVGKFQYSNIAFIFEYTEVRITLITHTIDRVRVRVTLIKHTIDRVRVRVTLIKHTIDRVELPS